MAVRSRSALVPSIRDSAASIAFRLSGACVNRYFWAWLASWLVRLLTEKTRSATCSSLALSS